METEPSTPLFGAELTLPAGASVSPDESLGPDEPTALAPCVSPVLVCASASVAIPNTSVAAIARVLLVIAFSSILGIRRMMAGLLCSRMDGPAHRRSLRACASFAPALDAAVRIRSWLDSCPDYGLIPPCQRHVCISG